jgi:hypothetical protein
MGPLLVLGYQFPFPRRGPRDGSSREPVENISKLQDRFARAGIGQLPATSLACSARSNHSRASFEIATIGSSRLYWKVGVLQLGPLSQLISLYCNHTAASDETACQIAAQSPSDKTKAIGSPAPGVSFVTAAVGSDRN